VFPAGFNNVCEVDQKRATELIKNYITTHYPMCKKILLLAEEHTKNLYYWDNIYIIKLLIQKAGYEVVVCVPGQMIHSPIKIKAASGREISIHLLKKEKGDLIVSNNDFSVSYDLPENLSYNPCLEMGWNVRKKHSFFLEYNKIAEEFASLVQMDPWCFKIETELFAPFDLNSKNNLTLLKERASSFLKHLKENQPDTVEDSPYIFLKNNSGTYGLGVTSIEQAEEVEHFNYKTRKKMKASKGGSGIKELILQEGIPTILSQNPGQNVEPVIYMIGSSLTGGFLRGHNKQGHKANLNSPGAIYKRLCISDLEIKVRGHMMENVYGWIGKLGVLALMTEIEKRGLDFRGYTQGSKALK